MKLGSRACLPLVGALLLLPKLAWADPEIWLVLGTIEPSDAPPDPTVTSEKFRPEAGAVLLREGDGHVLPTCDTPINLGFRSAGDASRREQAFVRLQKKRIASGCVLEVLAVGTDKRSAEGKVRFAPSAAGPSRLPPNDPRHIDARDVPCGTQLIVVREGRTGGSSLTVVGQGESGECDEGPDSMHSPLSFGWLDALKADAPPP